MPRSVTVLKSAEEVARRAAVEILSVIEQSIEERGECFIALSGGSTPRTLYELLVTKPFRGDVPWERVHVFFSDERCVPPDDELSNFRMAREAMLDALYGDAEGSLNVHRVRGELPAAEAAQWYEDEILDLVAPAEPTEGGDADDGDGTRLPRFDLILLGMGPDGHTASLFGGMKALAEQERIAVEVSEANPPRVSMTLPLINAAGSVMFLVTGGAKAEVVRNIIEQGNAGNYPAGRVAPVRGELFWLLDLSAASLL